jgi:OmpA-OmpF porin, OOP family
MKRNILIIFMFGMIGVCKSQTFSLTDSVVQNYDMLRTYQIHFYLGKAEIFPNSFPFLDSLADFLTKHQEIKLMEIRCHTDTESSNSSSKLFTVIRAEAILDYLYQKGIDHTRLSPVGYESNNPLFSEEEINSMKTKKEKEEAQYKNRRVEFVIMKVE